MSPFDSTGLGGGTTMKGVISMSTKELIRLEIVLKLIDGSLKQSQASEALRVSIR